MSIPYRETEDYCHSDSIFYLNPNEKILRYVLRRSLFSQFDVRVLREKELHSIEVNASIRLTCRQDSGGIFTIRDWCWRLSLWWLGNRKAGRASHGQQASKQHPPWTLLLFEFLPSSWTVTWKLR